MPFIIHEEIEKTVSNDHIQVLYLKDKIAFKGWDRYKRKCYGFFMVSWYIELTMGQLC